MVLLGICRKWRKDTIQMQKRELFKFIDSSSTGISLASDFVTSI